LLFSRFALIASETLGLLSPAADLKFK